MFRANKKENKKIEKLRKGKKIDYYLKCIKCCFKSIITSGILQTEELIPVGQHRTRFHQNTFITNNTNTDKSTITKFGQ